MTSGTYLIENQQDLQSIMCRRVIFHAFLCTSTNVLQFLGWCFVSFFHSDSENNCKLCSISLLGGAHDDRNKSRPVVITCVRPGGPADR